MKELDCVLEAYLERDYGGASAEIKRHFSELLELQDDILFGCLIGGRAPPRPELREVISAVRDSLRHGDE